MDLVVCNLVLEHIENLAFIFAEAERCLVEEGIFFVCELHPYRQYEGAQAQFRQEGETIEIPAFVHHISDFVNVAKHAGLTLDSFQEWWHEEDRGEAPRVVSFMFQS